MTNKCNLFNGQEKTIPIDKNYEEKDYDYGIGDFFEETSFSIITRNDLDLDELISNNKGDKCLSLLWNFKCIEGQFKNDSKYYIVQKLTKSVNVLRKGYGWLFCIRLHRFKRHILKHYLKELIHNIVREQSEQCKMRNQHFNSDIIQMKNKEKVIIKRILDKCIYIPKSRHKLKLLSIDKIEDTVNEEIGHYLYLNEQISKDLWNTFKVKIRNALISLFAGLGILELCITGLIA